MTAAEIHSHTTREEEDEKEDEELELELEGEELELEGEDDDAEHDFAGLEERRELSTLIETGQHVGEVISLDKISAAGLILAVYRRYKSRHRADMITSSLDKPSKLSEIFSSCLSNSKELKDTSSQLHQKLYLGALPHLLVCIGKARNYVHKAKSVTKQRIQVAEGKQVDELGKLQTDIK